MRGLWRLWLGFGTRFEVDRRRLRREMNMGVSSDKRIR